MPEEHSPTVLIVDDTEANRYALTRMLARAGYGVLEAPTGREGLDLAERGPDLIILDVNLPDINGFDVCRRLKSQPQTSSIPVLQVSASFVRAEDQARGLEGGADAYLVQPVDRQVLLATVAALMRVRRAEEELRAARDAAEYASQAKDRFLATLSHELRTPLTPVLATVHSLLEQGSSLPPDVRAGLRVIERNIELEARLIDDLLDLTRITKGKIQLSLQPVDVHSIINSAMDICMGDARRKRQTIVVNLNAPHPFVMGDWARLHQVLWNLLKNAVKFTPDGGRIEVRSENVDDELSIQVIDNGLGMDEAMLPRIFTAFEQGAPQITRQFGGLGLGLSISKALVELHGGRIRAHSSGLNKGAAFELMLKTIAAPAAGAARPVDPLAGLTGKQLHILLVEDHEDSSRAMARVLAGFGHRVQPARTVAEAKAAVRQQHFDLLISDIGLPDGNGIELMRDLRADAPGLAGIALSGYGMEEDVRRADDAGFGAHLTKPISIQQLDHAIRSVTFGAASSVTSDVPSGATSSAAAIPEPEAK